MPTTRTRTVIAALTLAAALFTSCGGTQSDDYDYQIDMTDYASAVTADGKAYLLLVNKQNPLGENYVPERLSVLDPSLTLYGKEIQLESTVALAAEALLLELHACGYTDIRITSGYRSYRYQQSLFNTYLGNEMAAHPDWTQAACEAQVLTYSARPGQSEHQSGLCMDLISTENMVLDESFADNPAYAWLVENAHHFGFILRYPEGGTEITGYSYEPWHYRFVGVKAATEMREKGLILEEYRNPNS